MPTASRRSAGSTASRNSSPQESPRAATKRAAAKKAAAPQPSPATVARRAMEQLADLTGKPPEGVTAVGKTEDGWTVEVEVVESRRIPDSTDILATYEVEMDPSGELTGYRRLRRYARGRTGDE